MMTTEAIQEGYDVFLHDGEKMVGAVRRVHPNEIVIYIENGGDFSVPVEAVKDVHDGKVVLHSGKLDHKLKEAIATAHGAEDPRI